MAKSPTTYSEKEVKWMKVQVSNLKTMLKEEKKRKPKDTARIKEIENLINGYENSISGKFN